MNETVLNADRSTIANPCMDGFGGLVRNLGGTMKILFLAFM